MGLILVGGQVLWTVDTPIAPAAQPNASTLHEWFMPNNTLTQASTAATFFDTGCFHVLDLGGEVDAIAIQGAMVLSGTITGDRTITAVTGSRIRAYAFGLPVVSTYEHLKEPRAVTLVSVADSAINAATGSALALSSGLLLACRANEQTVIGEVVPLFSAAADDGYVAGSGVTSQAIYIADATVPTAADAVNWSFWIGRRTSSPASQVPTGMGAPYLSTSGLDKVWIALKAVTVPVGGATTMAGITVSGRVHACFYQEITRVHEASHITQFPNRAFAV